MANTNIKVSSSFLNIPLTLQEAIDIVEHGEPSRFHTDINNSSISDETRLKRRRRRERIDIIGIVLKVLFEVLWKKVTFLITDSSIHSSSKSSYVKVILFGTNVLSNVMNGTIQQGDAVRFNDLRPSSNTMEFYSSSWKDYDVHTTHTTTCTYFKLGRVCRITKTIDISEERLVPTDMMTPPKLVYDMLHWYLNRQEGNDDPLCRDINPNISMYDNSAIGPCKRRQLCEITVPNLLSDIMVEVYSYTTRKDTILFFVRDGEQEEDVATLQLFRNGNHFSNLSSMLVQVCNTSQTIFVRQLLSQRIIHDYRTTATSSTLIKKDEICNNIILLTTHATTITIMEQQQQQPSNQLLPDENDHSCSILSTTLPSYFCPSTHKVQAKLWNIYFYDLDSYLFHTTKKAAIDTNACVTSLLLHSTSSLESKSDNKTAKFRPTAIFLLDCCDTSLNTTALSNDKKNKIMSVRANEDIMELLCGVSAQELSTELTIEPVSTSQEGEVSSQEKRQSVPSLSILLTNMLFALVQEELMLTWLLEERDDGDWHVIDIRLPEL